MNKRQRKKKYKKRLKKKQENWQDILDILLPPLNEGLRSLGIDPDE